MRISDWSSDVCASDLGAFLGFLFALSRKTMTWASFVEVVVESAKTTGMIFMVMIGALMLANFIHFNSLPQDLIDIVAHFNLIPLAVIFMIDRKSVVSGKRVSVRLDLGGWRIIK